MMKLPCYCIVGDRPVKAIPTTDGGMDILAYNWTTGEFERDITYLTRIVMGDHEVNYVSEQTFNQQVSELKSRF
jgi:hypothetical protein